MDRRQFLQTGALALAGAALAAVAGVMVGSYYGIAQYTMGSALGLKAFCAAVLGGIGNIPGAMLGGIVLGVVEALGAGYINTIIFWPHDMPLGMRIPMSIILSPVELIGKFTKPFALAIRLFANMTAGHIVVLALIGLIFSFGSYVLAPLPLAMAVAIMFLELMVAFLQAFIFTLLASVFIGLVRESHH